MCSLFITADAAAKITDAFFFDGKSNMFSAYADKLRKPTNFTVFGRLKLWKSFVVLDFGGCVMCLSVFVLWESSGIFTMTWGCVCVCVWGYVAIYCSHLLDYGNHQRLLPRHPCSSPVSQSRWWSTTFLANGAAAMFTRSQKAGAMIKHSG